MITNPYNNETVALTTEELQPVALFARQHQTAVLVILFTDVKGSTEQTEIRGEEYALKLRHQHDALLQSTFERDGSGRLIKKIGDALMYVFAEPSAAVARAVEVQQQLADHNRLHPDDPPIVVRIGLHMGQVLVESAVNIDVFGRHVNRAARVESLADGGQILMTHAVYDSARGWLAQEDVAWHDHGEYRLKGIPEPVRIIEVCGRKNPVLPRPPRGHRVSEWKPTRWILAGLSALLLLLTGYSLMTPPPEPAPPRIEVTVQRAGPAPVKLSQAVPLLEGDELRIQAKFSLPVYAAILLLDQSGTATLLATSDDRQVVELTYPDVGTVPVTGSEGTDMLIAIQSSRPIVGVPAAVSGQPWELANLAEDDETVWITADRVDTARSAELEGSRSLGSIIVRPGDVARAEVDRLRRLLQKESLRFQAVAYRHR